MSVSLVDKEAVYAEVDKFISQNNTSAISIKIDEIAQKKAAYEKWLNGSTGIDRRLFRMLGFDKAPISENEYEKICYMLGRMINQYNSKIDAAKR